MERLEVKKINQFLVSCISFIILGSCFKVMVLIEGVTEVRPVNAIPVPAGLFFGPLAGLGCAVGNLVSDLFGTLTATSVIGFAANFMAAYMPYRLWHIYVKEEPNVHSFHKLLVYVWITFVSALSASWMIATGIWLFRDWVPDMAVIVFLNGFVFPILFGLPVFIVMTSDAVRIRCTKAPESRLHIPDKWRKILINFYMVILQFLMLLTIFGENRTMATVLSVPALILTILIIV